MPWAISIVPIFSLGHTVSWAISIVPIFSLGQTVPWADSIVPIFSLGQTVPWVVSIVQIFSLDSYLTARQCLGLQVLVQLFLDYLVGLGAPEIHQEEQVHSVLTHYITIIERYNRNHFAGNIQEVKNIREATP